VKIQRFVVCLLLLILSISAMVPMNTYAATNKCAYVRKYEGPCTKNAISGSRYCKSHTCVASGCNNLTTHGANSRCDSCQKKYLYDSGITSPGCNIDG